MKNTVKEFPFQEASLREMFSQVQLPRCKEAITTVLDGRQSASLGVSKTWQNHSHGTHLQSYKLQELNAQSMVFADQLRKG